MTKAELPSAIRESIAAAKDEIVALQHQAKDRMHDRTAMAAITQQLRSLRTRLGKLERNLREST
jgi:hypothetical protein